jgi:spore maturation protein CgeB
VIPAKVLVVILKDDYGIPSRGASYEDVYFHGTLRTLFRECQLFDFGPYLSRKDALQGDLLAAAERFRPDVVFFTLYEEQFQLDTLDALRRGALTVNWFCDDQWRFESFSSRYAPHFSWVVTTDRFAVHKYRDRGLEHVILSQWAAGEVGDEDGPGPEGYAFDVSFVGGINPFRKWMVGELAKRGIEVACFGTGWPRGRVGYARMQEIFRTSKVNLNLSNSRSFDLRFAFASLGNLLHVRGTPKDKEQIKGRHFEVGAWGGFQLTNYVEFLEDYFEIGKEIAVFGSLDDLPDKIRFYLRDEDLRCAIAASGHRRIRAEHTYDHRFREIFARMGLEDR